MFISKRKLAKIKMEFWTQGFDNGRKKAVNETRKVFVKLLTEEINQGIDSTTYGLQRAVSIIRKGKR